MVTAAEFLFFFSSGRWTAKSARGVGGDGGARDWERGPQNRRGIAADCPGFEYISMLIYYIYLSFDAHSAIILQY